MLFSPQQLRCYDLCRSNINLKSSTKSMSLLGATHAQGILRMVASTKSPALCLVRCLDPNARRRRSRSVSGGDTKQGVSPDGNLGAIWVASMARKPRRIASAILNSQFSILNSQFSILNSQFSILNSQFSILNSQLTLSTCLHFRSCRI
jgi:hypothetical protein